MSEYTNTTVKNPGKWAQRLIVFTPTLGLVRAEWIQARYGQIIPTNWSMVEFKQGISSYVPIEYQLADAQNLLAKLVVEHDYEWVLYIEDDNIIPPDFFMKMNRYMNEGKIPVVSGLYFTKSRPPEPLIYRGRGNSYFGDWKIGDRVWCDGAPFGARLEHGSLIKAAWKESPEYKVGEVVTRRVFEQPTDRWYDPAKGGFAGRTGTTDLAWCSRLIEDRIFEKAGFPEIQKMRYPILVDTNIFVYHIDQSGVIFPTFVPPQFVPDNQETYVGQDIID